MDYLEVLKAMVRKTVESVEVFQSLQSTACAGFAVKFTDGAQITAGSHWYPDGAVATAEAQ